MVFILLKILVTRPIKALGTLSKRNEFLIILTPEFATPINTEIKRREVIYLLLIKIISDMLVNTIKMMVNLFLLKWFMSL